jgi:threonine dehydratase
VTVTLADVEQARAVLGVRIHRTPTLSSAALGAWLKGELFQKTGSFKVRGVLNRMAALGDDERRRGVVTWSAGNHAQAVAWAAAQAGVECLVVMSAHASPLKVEATRAYGAEVDREALTHAAAYDRLLEVVERTGRVFVHPFDDPLVVAGHGTVGLEILEDVPDATTIVVPAGGGALTAGITVAAAGRARVVAVSPERAPAFPQGLAAGRSVPVEPDSIADGLSPPFAGELPIALCHGVVEPVLVSEEEIAEAMRFLYVRTKLACEPAGAAAAAAVLAGKVEAGPGVVVVVSGGNVDPAKAAAILAAR